MSRDLPEFPNLDHLKKQAKVILRELQQRKPESKLSEAQHAVARAYGFPSWAKLKAHVESLKRKPTPAATSQFARYAEDARLAIFFARAWSRKLESETIEAEHLLLGLIDANGNLFDRLLGDHAARETEFVIRREIDSRRTKQEKVTTFQRPLASECRGILQHASEEADRLHHERISSGHFLLGFLLEKDSFATSILVRIFSENGMSLEKVQASIVETLKRNL